MIALTPTLYEPSAVPAGEVTVSVAEPLLPGDRDKPAAFHTPGHPDGNALAKLNVVTEHPELSLSLTVTVKFTGVPEVTDWLADGETPTVGFAAVHVDPFSVT